MKPDASPPPSPDSSARRLPPLGPAGPLNFVPLRRRAASLGWRPVALVALAALCLAAIARPAGLAVLVAQEPTAPAADELTDEPTDEGAPAAGSSGRGAAARKEEPSLSLLDLFWASGAIGMIITLSSMVALGFVVEHAMSIRRSRLLPDDVVAELDRLIGAGQLDAALDFLRQPHHDSLVSEVVRAGLERYKNSEFGFAEYRTAVEEAGEEFTNRLYRKTEALNVIGAVAPMLGLLGTVQGMILAFNTIAAKGGMARPDELAGSISLALVTTFEGLIVAIPAMVAFSYFRNRIDSLVAEAGKRVEHLLLPLGRQRGRGPGA